MKERNMEQLAARMVSLGCEPSIRGRLEAYACFSPAQFEIRQCVQGNPCDFIIHCVIGDQGLYDALYYTAILKQQPTVPEGLKELDMEMAGINWPRLWEAREKVIPEATSDVVKAAAVFQQINEVDTTGILRFRHWSGTALEPLVPNLASLKSQYELAQRFYLLPNQPPIRFEEAYRFLQSRGMEKRISASRKLLTKNERTESSTTGAKSGKLLTKRTKANRKPGLFNK